MDISELVFIYLGPFLYNLIFISLWILWFMYHREEENQGLKRLFRKYLQNEIWFYIITGSLIVIFLYFLFSYAIWNTDVDDAITSAVQAFLRGDNPYQKDVVEHHVNSETIPGRYHYFPPDLLTYSLFYYFFGSIFSPYLYTYWFVPLHLILIIPGYWIITQLVPWPHHRLIPFSALLITPFLFTNSMLMWFFFLIGYYFFEKKEQPIIGMTFYVLAASVKYMVGFIIFFYFIQSLRKLINENQFTNWRVIGHELAPFVVSSLILTLICLPFGIFDVIKSVFLYQGDPQYREEVAQSVGPLLIEILKILNLTSFYLLILGAIVILALIIVWKQSTYAQIIHFSFLSMIILPFYATELFITLPFFFWFKEGFKAITGGNQTALLTQK
ncbi:MAG: hypothetical protein JSW11_03560 [Candidatus Heimdallarchaeota archaeon]|nr:MAG: hypothetical protein JSW11_03560 [Candidatus Heimdallarchaeota archaeon]